MKTFRPFEPAARGFHSIFRADSANHCPGCGRSQWIVGRATAECAFCATALPIADATASSAPLPRLLGKGGGKVLRVAVA